MTMGFMSPGAIAAGLAAALALGHPVAASAASAEYDVKHVFVFTPAVGETNRVTHVWGNNTDAQPGGLTCIKSGEQEVPGKGANITNTCASAGPKSSANSLTNATVGAFAANGPIGASINAKGSATADGGSAFATSFSRLNVDGGAKNKQGRIEWKPRLRSTVAGSGRVGKRDPISFELTDLDTSATLSGTLIDIESSMGAPGSFSWDGETFALDATEFHFSIDISSPYTVQQGTVDLLVSGGLVTTSTATGIFANMFPSVGAAGSFSVPFGDITLDYDLGDFGDHALAVDFEFAGSGVAQVVPEPSSVALLGIGLIGLIGHGRWRAKRATRAST